MFWNNYFQIVVFLCFAPNVAIFYFIINTFSNFSGNVQWEDIVHILKLLKKSTALKDKDTEYFKKLDINKDGLLNFSQFFKFTTYNYTLWEPLYRFRISLIETIFPNESIFIILDRKLKISKIKEYQAIHNGRDPPQTCVESIKNLILGKPNPLHYDYDNCYETPSLTQITCDLIKRYNRNFFKRYETFSSKNLCTTIEFPVLNKIDKYYRQYRLSAAAANAANNNTNSNFNSNCTNQLVTPNPSSKMLLVRYSSAYNNNNNNNHRFSSRPPSGFESGFMSNRNSAVNTPSTINTANANNISRNLANFNYNNSNNNLRIESPPHSPILRHKSTLKSERRMTLDRNQLLGIVKSSASSRAIQNYLNQSHGNRGLSPTMVCRPKPLFTKTTISPISPLADE